MIRGGTQIVTQTLQSAGPVSCCTSALERLLLHRHVEFDLQPGDKYGFRMAGSHNDRARLLSGKLTLRCRT